MLKQSEIATIILVAGISLAASFFIANLIINPGERSQDVLSVQQIDDAFPEIEQDIIFPEDSLNPTQQVTIGGDRPDTPFQQSDD